MCIDIKKENDIRELINSRIRQCRISQQKLADQLGCTQAKLSLFLNSTEDKDSGLRIDELETLFNIFGIKTQTYLNRSKLAKDVAAALIKKTVTPELVKELPKDILAQISGYDSVKLFLDPGDPEEYQNLLNSGLIDEEIFYPWFNSMVRYLMIATADKDQKITISSTKKATEKLKEEASPYFQLLPESHVSDHNDSDYRVPNDSDYMAPCETYSEVGNNHISSSSEKGLSSVIPDLTIGLFSSILPAAAFLVIDLLTKKKR